MPRRGGVFVATATIRKLPDSPSGFTVIEISETAVALTTEVEIDLATYGIPRQGRVLEQKAQLVSGTGTLIAPRLATASGTSLIAPDVIVEDDGTTADPINALQMGGHYGLSGRCHRLYHRSRPNTATADNVIVTVYLFQHGWGTP